MPKIFFSYSHKDEAFCDQLEIHLSALKRQKVIESWHDRKIVPGSAIDDAVDQHLNDSDVILLLISPDFIASDYCYEKEVRRALERHSEGSARVIPVILRPCDWHALPFGKILAAPTDGQAITLWPNRDEAFLDVVKSIKAAIRYLSSPSTLLTPPRPAAAETNPGLPKPSAEGTFGVEKVDRGSSEPEDSANTLSKQATARRRMGRGLAALPRVGIDMGAKTTRICIAGRGMVLSEPSVVAAVRRTRRVVAVGNAALESVSADGDHIMFRPLREGVICEPDLAAYMLRNFLETVDVPSGCSAVFSVPAVATNADLKVLLDVARRAKLRKIQLVERPLLAAFGVRRVLEAPEANTVVEIGTATTDVAVIAKSRVFVSRAVRVGGNQIDEAVCRFARRVYNLLIGQPTAERVKIEVGSAWKLDQQLVMPVKGRNLIEGIPKVQSVTDSTVREAIVECIQPIFKVIQEVRDLAPRDILSEPESDYILLSGGGALMRGIGEAIRDRIGVRVQVQEDPINSVARGLGALLSGDRSPARPLVYPIYQ